jgi:hypothetical protein
MTCSFAADFETTAARFEAWWQRELIDRPVITASVRPHRPYEGPPRKTYATWREHWFDVAHRVDCTIADMARRDYVADALPLVNPNMGPDITATPFGCPVEYSEHSSWSVPIFDRPDDWAKLDTITLDFDNEHWQAVERFMDLAIDQCDGRYLVGMTDLHGNFDILASLRDPQALCMDLIDRPDAVGRAAMQAAEAFNEMFRRQWAKVSAAGMGSTCWTPYYHAGPAYVTSCDFWCMVSDAMARELVLPAIRKEMALLERSIFHLDGPAALRHLDLLLGLEELDAVQWVYGAGAGPAAKWIEVYQRCQRAGKAVQVLAESADDALAVLEQLQPEGVWLCVGEAFSDVASAEAFVKDAERVAGR